MIRPANANDLETLVALMRDFYHEDADPFDEKASRAAFAALLAEPSWGTIWPDDRNRYEIVDGKLFVTAAPSRTHQRAVLELALHLAPYLKAEGLGEAVIAPVDVEITPDTMVEPDVFIVPPVAGRPSHAWTEPERILLAVEILSPTTARADRVRKRQLYARVRTPEYWIVDVDARVVERWRPDDERPEVLSEWLEWRPHAERPALTIDLMQFFAEVVGD